ncbi:MAG: O-antigen ligase family protein [Rhodospirillales bacterium]|nr:O-antigen ligase family protein [Rhodospirillales bacterium]MCB9994917.1 O-antigen ligase family protein [Rhodospirillales bacterium]
MTEQDQTVTAKRVGIFIPAFIAILTLMPLIAFISPRFLAYWPGLGGLVLAGLYYAETKSFPAINKTLLAVVCSLLILAGGSSLWALDPSFALERTFKIALILIPSLLFWAVIDAVPVAAVKPYLKYAAYACAFFAGVLAFDMAFNFPVSRFLHGLSFADHFEKSNLNRGLIAVTAASLAAYSFLGKHPQPVQRLAFLLPLLAALCLTQSQSAQLGAILAVLFFFAFPYSHQWAWKLVAGLLLICLFGAPFLAMWLFGQFAADIATMPVIGQGGGFGAQRLEIWDAVARKALEHPLWGMGIEATRAVEAFDTAQIYRKGVTELHPHNFAIQLWIEFGVLGALWGSAVFVLLFRALSRLSYGAARSSLPVLMFFMPVLAFGYGMWQSWLLGLLVLSFAFARLAMRLYEEKDA